MTSFEALRQFHVPAELAGATDAQLRDAGRARVERFVLWSGTVEDDEFHVRTMHVPKQTAYRLREGLCVRVEGQELHKLNLWLFEHRERLAIQVHSHPTEAYHSDTDDTYPIVTTRGGLSLVVPDFGRYGVRGPRTALYRLSGAGWLDVPALEAARLLEFGS